MPDYYLAEEACLLQYNDASNEVLVDVTRYALDGDADKYIEMGYSTYLNLETVIRIPDDCGDFGSGGWQALLNKNSVLLTIEEWKTLMGFESYLANQFFQDSIIVKKMWMLYAEKHWVKAIFLKSAKERLYKKLGALEFDADHEAIYGMKKYYYTVQRDKYKIGKQ
ncbi:hypothetical protein FQA39_LY16291 [Lamprigera yunnana]|nr:hypothetical protein FQA39_LY16291 [Lamprigera yunnana]